MEAIVVGVCDWESYFRGGAIAACPSGPDTNYTRELRDVWAQFFSRLASGARILDIGTGNGAIPLIARQTAQSLERTFDIHGADLARINPNRDVADGERLFAGITFHPGVAAENLPFAAASVTAVTGQYALEYTDMPLSLAQVMRVLKPGCDAQFIMHHANSMLVERARTSLRHSDIVLQETKVYRKLRKFLELEKQGPAAARRSWDRLSTALSTLRESERFEPDRRVINVTLDAIQKLLELRWSLHSGTLAREVDSVEDELRTYVRRINDLIAASVTEPAMQEFAWHARAQGFVGVTYLFKDAHEALMAWCVHLHKPDESAARTSTVDRA
jgi:ubiquinone/menaquinone biosynthesis C-methylase UbiE